MATQKPSGEDQRVTGNHEQKRQSRDETLPLLPALHLTLCRKGHQPISSPVCPSLTKGAFLSQVMSRKAFNQQAKKACVHPGIGGRIR